MVSVAPNFLCVMTTILDRIYTCPVGGVRLHLSFVAPDSSSDLDFIPSYATGVDVRYDRTYQSHGFVCRGMRGVIEEDGCDSVDVISVLIYASPEEFFDVENIDSVPSNVASLWCSDSIHGFVSKHLLLAGTVDGSLNTSEVCGWLGKSACVWWLVCLQDTKRFLLEASEQSVVGDYAADRLPGCVVEGA